MSRHQLETIAHAATASIQAHPPATHKVDTPQSPQFTASALAPAGALGKSGATGQAATLTQASGGQLARAGSALLQLQRNFGNRYVQRVVNSARQAGSPNRTGLPDGLKAGIESLSGMSLDNVKVHYNSSRPAQLNALAYTQGNEIHVAPGQEQHLPHEAWHVVQQAQGRVQPTMQMNNGVAVNDDKRLEHEADVMGAKVMATAAQDSRSYGGLVVSDMTPYKPVISTGLRPHSANSIQRKACTFYANDNCTGSKFEAASFHNLNNQDSPAESWNCSWANGDTTCHTPVPKKGECVCASGHNTGTAPTPPKLSNREKKKKKFDASNKKRN